MILYIQDTYTVLIKTFQNKCPKIITKLPYRYTATCIIQ